MASDEMLTWLRTTIQDDLALAQVAGNPERYGVKYTGHWTYTRDTIARCESELAIIAECIEVPGRGTLAERTVDRLVLGYRHRPGFNPDWVSD